jgi:hypothetical protein
MQGDADYFGRRARQERVAAMKASHPNARASHLQMASRYDELANAISAYQPMIVEKAS